MKIVIECKSCKGTGVYQGMGESSDVAIICHTCKGTGWTVFEYTEFTGRKNKQGVSRVYLNSYGYKISTGVVNFDGIGKVDMDKEGVSYEEFCEGKMPTHIKQLGCPMLADQGRCRDIAGFTNRCDSFNGGWLNYIPSCENKANSAECWRIFEEAIK